ncbi:exosortase F system-associated membrane protein [Aureitalea marina]|uniref:Exosortase F system-associated protein n=1 Tax=Aureitalea marina TaxID=930804 RepID=A0A2S7KLV0_9FLAO|nr:exosortase F system-associated protein [Aureitalea marina]PQB03582.1 exosortase F system-associated protein [Aureitalea marina]
MTRWVSIALVGLLLLALAAIRLFQEELFYDPLVQFFYSDYKTADLPELQNGKLIVNLGYRFLLNTILSLVILGLAFNSRSVVQFSALIYLVAFVLLMSVFYYQLLHYKPGHYMMLFYTRRFLIQPILVLVLLPAFYFQKNG